jgi:signal transduction histidine kinase
MRNAVSPFILYRLLGVLGPRGTPCIQGTTTHIDGVIHMRLALVRADLQPCELYWDVTATVMRRMPSVLMGIGESTVTWTSPDDGRSAHFVIHPAASRSIWARVRRAWAVLMGTDIVFEALEEANNSTLKAYAELQTTHGQLETKVKERTHELGRLNRGLVAASDAKSRYLADMSHELRTPLNAIIGYSEMLTEDAEEQGLSTFLPDLGRVELAARHLLALIDNVLDLSRIESGHMPVNPEAFELGALVESVVTAVRPVIESGGNDVVVEIEGTPRAYADPMRVRQILVNVLGNAGKFTSAGRVTVRVANGCVEVEDTGIGMSAEQLQHLFQPFEQASSNTVSNFGGTGLGMAISQRLATLMGGELSATSTQGAGSTFRLTVPMNADANVR